MRNSIRNFSIIAHIDHGKSTFADRILEITHAVEKRKMHPQFLDRMDIERERGITIRSQPVKLNYRAKDGKTYELNLIDTPGHVDFTYEVSRSLKACEGAILLVDASQGVEAQTVSNVYLAMDNDLEIIPVINKIDLSNADVDATLKEIENLLGFVKDEIYLVSAKTGEGVGDVLEAVIDRLPSPSGNTDAPLKALVFGAEYDEYRGIIVHIRCFDGRITAGMSIKFMATEEVHKVEEVGIFTPDLSSTNAIEAGEVGYVIANIKSIRIVRIGDTITSEKNPCSAPLPGYREVKPMVFCGMYPVDTVDYEALRYALEKIKLNDASIVFEENNSPALGFGFRVGFLGLLHMDVIRERLEKEYSLNIIMTIPNVPYKIELANSQMKVISNPADFPPMNEVKSIREPYALLSIITPQQYMSGVIELVKAKRGEFKSMNYITPFRVLIEFEMPYQEMIFGFFDKLKAVSHGYASLDYQIEDYRTSELVRVDILVNKERVDAMSMIIHKNKASTVAREVLKKLRELIPRHLFKIPLQAVVGEHIIARETIRELRKDVLAKCYGGDVTRKKKLLEKQKRGKKRMMEVGKVNIPQSAFLALLKIENK